MADNETKYESKTVRAIRGTEARTIAKWEQAGWEVVGQSSGRLQTEIRLRRPQPKRPWPLLAGLGGFLVLLMIFVLVMGAIEDEDNTVDSTPTAQPSEEVQASEDPSAPPSQEPQASAPPTDEVLTVANNADLMTLLTTSDNCSETIGDFAATHAGRIIQFDGSIGAMAPHGDATTRYDILVVAGDYSETASAGGPAFQFRDVNTFDLHLTGENIPDTLGVGDNLRVTAEVGEFIPEQCLFLLEPEETTFR